MERMETHGNPVIAVMLTITSWVSGFIAFISIKDVHVWVSIFAGCVAIVSGFFAIRYYYHSTKKIKNESRKQDQVG